MRAFAFIIIASLALAACKKSKDGNTANQLNGSYTGTFSRTGMDTANVLLNFVADAKTFDGTSDKDKYPAICHGTFDLDQGSITFTNSCTWTADFDWTLILSGTYNISFDNTGNIRIWRTSGGTDEYLLRKLVR